MAQFLTYVYLFYIFLTLYFLFLYLLVYIPNRKKFFDYPKPSREYSLDMVIPCYNEEKSIGKTIENILGTDYPGLKKVIVVDHGSTDNSYNVIKEYEKKDSKVMVVKCPRKWKNAAEAKNYGAKFATSELVGFTDSDSYPEKESIRKMIGFFDDQKTGAVTSSVLVHNPKNLLEKLQSIEYRIIVFTRRLLGFVDAIYVTPGPLAIYRKSVLTEIGGFDENNMTEDIEITWHIISKGYLIRMSPPARVYTEVPSRLRDWFKQRMRWNIGGVQTIKKYKETFMRKGMLGNFILPYFILSWIIGISGLAILFYRIIQAVIIRVLSTTYSIQNQAAIISLQDLNLVPNVFFIFGIFILVFGFIFTLIALKYTKGGGAGFKKVGPLTLLGYSFLYLLTYPILLIISIYRILIRKKYHW